MNKENEAVATVYWHDPALDVTSPRARKIIDATIAWFDAAQIGDVLYPQSSLDQRDARIRELEVENATAHNAGFLAAPHNLGIEMSKLYARIAALESQLRDQAMQRVSDFCQEQEAAQAGSVKIPTTADEAALMTLTGIAWLKEHAPERLRDQAPARQPLTDEQIAANSPGHEWRSFTDGVLFAEQFHGITGESQ